MGWGGGKVCFVWGFLFVCLCLTGMRTQHSPHRFLPAHVVPVFSLFFLCVCYFFFHLLHNANETNVSSPFRALKKQTHYCQQLFQCNLILQNSFNSTCKFVVLLLLRGSVHMQCKQFNFRWLSGVLNFHLCITSVHS